MRGGRNEAIPSLNKTVNMTNPNFSTFAMLGELDEAKREEWMERDQKRMTPEQSTLETICSNLAFGLGFHTSLPNRLKKVCKNTRYDDQWERGNRSCALRSLKDILRWHPELRSRAANWIRKGLEGGR